MPLPGMTRVHCRCPPRLWALEILQDSGHEGPTQVVGVPGPYVGCGPTVISRGSPHIDPRYRGYLFSNRVVTAWVPC
jgi:hypothetical protein